MNGPNDLPEAYTGMYNDMTRTNAARIAKLEGIVILLTEMVQLLAEHQGIQLPPIEK